MSMVYADGKRKKEERVLDLRWKKWKKAERTEAEKMVLAAMFLALAIIMPFLIGQIPEIGSRLLPMHIPVLLCGFVCGWKSGLLVGFVAPILRSLLFGVPVLMPTAAAMAFELAVYGAVTGFFYHSAMVRRYAEKHEWTAVYGTLISAMVLGRLVCGLVSIPLYGITGSSFSVSMFISSAYLNAIPGIILQLAVVPILIFSLKRADVGEM